MDSLWKESGCCALYQAAAALIKNSRVYALAAALAAWLGGLLRESLIFHFFTDQRQSEPEGTLSQGIRAGLHCQQVKLWHALHLDRLLEGSIFLKTGFWCALPIVFAPLLPTMAVLGLVLAGFASLILTLGCRRELRPVYSPLNKWVVLYALIYAFATCASVTFSGSLLVGMISICFLLFYLVVITSIQSWSGLRRLIFAMLLAGTLVALYGFWQYLHPEQFASAWLDTDMFSSITMRVYSTLANPNVLGTYLLLIIPFAAAMMITASGVWKKLVYAGICAMLAVCLVLTYSRGCYLGILFAALVFLILLDRRFLIPMVILLLLCPFILPDTILTRFTSIGDMSDSSTSYRVYIWMGTLDMLKDYWFCGIGPGEAAFDLVYPSYAYSAITAPHSHSLYLQILCETGVVGFAAFLGMIVSFFRSMCSALKRETRRDVRIFQIAAIASVAGFLVEGATDYTFYNYRVTLLFWCILGIGTLLARADRLKRADLGGRDLWQEEPSAPDAPRKLRVLNILSDTNIGGAGRCLLNYLKYSDRAHVETAVVLPTGSVLKPAVEALGTPVIEADIEGDRSLDPAAVPVLRSICAAADPDIIHTHGSMSGRIAARGSHAKLIYTRHSAFPVPDNMKRGLRHQTNRLINALYADRIIAVSPATAENLTDSGIPAGRIEVVMNGVEPLVPADAETQAQWKSRLGLKPDDFVVGMLARLEEYKGHTLLLEAAAVLRDEGYPIRVLIAGAGSYEDAIRAKIQELQLEDTVQLLGFTSQVPEFLSILDVQVNCSWGTEATSLSLLEGFSLGVPAVVSSYGGNPWLVTDGENGLIFENRNAEALEDRLRRLMDDRDLLNDMSASARIVFKERYTGKIFAENIERIYRDVRKK